MEKLTAITIVIVLVVVAFIVLHKPKEEVVTDCESTIKIISPHSYEYSCFEKDMPLVFEGRSLIDCKDTSNMIMWESNKDGKLKVGNKFTSSLSVGTHIITAQIDNKATCSMTIRVDKDIVKKQELQKEDIAEVKDIDGDILTVNRTKGVVTDTSKGLMWQRKPETYQYTYKEAISYAKNSKLAGYSDWRLPTQAELADIHNIYHDRRNAIISKEFSTFEGKFWSSTPITTDAGYKFMGGVEQVHATRSFFHSSFVNIALDGVVYVRLVRNI